MQFIGEMFNIVQFNNFLSNKNEKNDKKPDLNSEILKYC